MTNTINFKITTPEKTVYENDTVEQVTLPTMDGEITVLPGHIPLVSILKAGEMLIKDRTGEHPIAVAGGFLEVRGNSEIVILADNAEAATEIDIARAEAARVRAEQQMKEKSVADVDYARLQAVIDREMNRIRVGKKYQKFAPGGYKKLQESEELASRAK